MLNYWFTRRTHQIHFTQNIELAPEVQLLGYLGFTVVSPWIWIHYCLVTSSCWLFAEFNVSVSKLPNELIYTTSRILIILVRQHFSRKSGKHGFCWNKTAFCLGCMWSRWTELKELSSVVARYLRFEGPASTCKV